MTGNKWKDRNYIADIASMVIMLLAVFLLVNDFPLQHSPGEVEVELIWALIIGSAAGAVVAGIEYRPHSLVFLALLAQAVLMPLTLGIAQFNRTYDPATDRWGDNYASAVGDAGSWMLVGIMAFALPLALLGLLVHWLVREFGPRKDKPPWTDPTPPPVQ